MANFEQTFKNIDDLLYKDSGADSEIDYIEQTSWVLFLRYLDSFDKNREDEATLEGKNHTSILEPKFQWENWAAPKNDKGEIDIHKALIGPDLVKFVEFELFPYLASFKEKHIDNPKTIEYKIGEIFSELSNKIKSGYNMREIINMVDGLPFGTSVDKHELSHLYETKIKNMGNAGRNGGQYYTPRPLIRAMIALIEPKIGEKIYDPACGSGGMFVQSIKFIENHHGNKKEISIYGQEYTATTYKLAKMNLAIRGIAANLGDVPADTFGKDQHPDLKADFIMANPPFNQKDWRASDELTDDPRWRGYDVPPTSNANYAWILNMVAKLSENGVAGFILANGALSGGGEEYKIRRKLIENDLVEAIVILPRNMFYTTDISVTLWILNKNKKARTVQLPDAVRNYRDRQHEILFLDLREKGIPFEKKYTQFSDENIIEITEAYHNWQTNLTKYQDVPEFCYAASIDEIVAKDYSLVPSKYITFINRDENIDFEDKMKSLQTEFSELLKAEEQSKNDLLTVFKELGYAIEL